MRNADDMERKLVRIIFGLCLLLVPASMLVLIAIKKATPKEALLPGGVLLLLILRSRVWRFVR